MKSYNEVLNELFQRWEEISKQHGDYGFCRDGLMYKGDSWSDGRYSGREDELWSNSPKRVLFLLKDTNKNPNRDIREWKPTTDKKHYLNIAYWLYGLLHFDNDGNSPDFDSIDIKELTSFFDDTPYAIVNSKKESGSGSIQLKELAKYISKYGDFLKEQILILDPDIVVCGGGQSYLKNYVEENIYNSLSKVNNWMYYSPNDNKLVIDSYHPSYTRRRPDYSCKYIYSTMMKCYKELLDHYPKFKDSCRQ
ncbi:hypothetical protein Barb6XT_01846 [Bacteroidales bacterium Barb6XT]|nr:hypothetical protein Barb6XT_01846 [Bacteroidales bacterium Barb6XT]